MDETDLFFNLRLGEIILSHHAVPRTNLLSFTFPDARDINLLFFGAGKRAVYEASLKPGPVEEYPIRALVHQPRVPVTVFWAP